MNFLERIGLARPKVERSFEIIDAPKRSNRSDVLRFAGSRPQGFTDDELFVHMDRPFDARTTIISCRLQLEREGLIIKAGTRANGRGNPVNVYKSVAFADGPVTPPKRRPTYAQLRTKLTTAQMEISVLQSKLAEYEAKQKVAS